MTSNLDKTDILILQTLQKDASLTNKQLAAKVHLSPTPVYERVKRLKDEGYIKGITAILDVEKLGCSFAAFCFIKLKQHTYENANNFMSAIQNIKEVGECYNITGDYDFVMKVYVSSMKEYQQFVLKILGDLDCIGGLSSSFIIGEVKDTHCIPVE